MLHLDGFASLASNYDGGRVTIRPFALNGNELWVNAKTDYGQLTVELLDGEEKPIPGIRGRGLRRPSRGRGSNTRALARRWGIERVGGTAGTAAFCAKQRPALRLLVSVVFGRKINLEIARGL